VAAIEKTRELLLARKNVVATGHRADALLLKRSSKFQELRLVAALLAWCVCPPFSSTVDRSTPNWSPTGAARPRGAL
jgi:hypothetical protein